jgi:hypothetical protein
MYTFVSLKTLHYHWLLFQGAAGAGGYLGVTLAHQVQKQVRSVKQSTVSA